MDTQLLFGNATNTETPMLAVFAVDIAAAKNEKPQPVLLTSLNNIQDATKRLIESGEFKATLGEVVILHGPTGLKAERLLLVGLGKAKDFSLDRVRKGAGDCSTGGETAIGSETGDRISGRSCTS